MEASCTDLLTSSHIYVVLIALGAYLPAILAYRSWLKKRRLWVFLLTILFTLIAMFFSLWSWQMSYPCSGPSEYTYKGDKAIIRELQKGLDLFWADCHIFPTTNQGLQALVEKPKNLDCNSYSKILNRVPESISYQSDGQTYVIKTLTKYNVEGLVVEGTDKNKAKLLIRK